jgi:hypothetical protein
MGSSVCYSGNCECFENINCIIATGEGQGGEKYLDGDVVVDVQMLKRENENVDFEICGIFTKFTVKSECNARPRSYNRRCRRDSSLILDPKYLC